jgi:hypothetical protein
MTTRNRIVGYEIVDARTLNPNPLNWRDHPEHQATALDQALDAIGWVKAVIVNRRTNRMIDGHLRVERAAARGEKVPVLYVNLTEREEALVLATLDPIAGEAGTDTEKLAELLGDLRNEFEQLDTLLREVALQGGVRLDSDGTTTMPPASGVTCPRCGHQWDQ